VNQVNLETDVHSYRCPRKWPKKGKRVRTKHGVGGCKILKLRVLVLFQIRTVLLDLRVGSFEAETGKT